MRAGAAYRGQPLVALLLLLGGWIAVRSIAVDARMLPLTTTAPRAFAVRAGTAGVAAPPAGFLGAWRPGASSSSAPEAPVPRAQPVFAPAPRRLGLATRSPVGPARSGHRVAEPRAPFLAPSASPALSVFSPAPPGLLPRSPDLAPPVAPAPGTVRPSSPRDARWSADGWLLLRSGGAAPSAGGLAPPAYGASQAGAVLRYRMAPASRHRPALYARASAALNGTREREAAFGASVRPIARLPVVAAVEARVNDQPGGTHVRPAILGYTELPPLALARGVRAELYGQAGYVGGDFSSAFVDGQLRVDRRFVKLGAGELRAGFGAWGGAQKGASRLDVGPGATASVPLPGNGAARVGVDWRFRVAGNAAPASGPAVTLSAGF